MHVWLVLTDDCLTDLAALLEDVGHDDGGLRVGQVVVRVAQGGEDQYQELQQLRHDLHVLLVVVCGAKRAWSGCLCLGSGGFGD
jgi:hypothetical protein